MPRRKKIVHLQTEHTVILGLKGSGKSELAGTLAMNYNNPLIFDPMDQFRALKHATIYIPTHREYGDKSKREISDLIIHMLEMSPRPDLFIMDEASRFCPNKRPLPDGIARLVDLNRHFHISIIFIARRPAQIHTDIVELSQKMYIFLLRGRNDHIYLKNQNMELGSDVGKLAEFNYCEVDANRNYKINPPVELINNGRGLVTH